MDNFTTFYVTLKLGQKACWWEVWGIRRDGEMKRYRRFPQSEGLDETNDRWLHPEMISSRKITFFFFYLYHLTWMKMTHCFPLTELSTTSAISNMWTQWVVHWESDSKPDRLSLINWGASEPLSSTEGAETLKLSHRLSLPRQPMPRLKWITRVRYIKSFSQLFSSVPFLSAVEL